MVLLRNAWLEFGAFESVGNKKTEVQLNLKLTV